MKIIKLSTIALSVIFLTACTSYKVDVELPDDERTKLIAEVKELEDKVSEYSSAAEIPRIDLLDLAAAYEQLGEIGKAIDLYEDAIKDGALSTVIFHNLGRLYEKVGEYDKAIEQYQRIIDIFYDQNYLYDITWAYIRAGERKEAEKYFNAWQLQFQKTDEQTQQAIKKLREEEQAAQE